MVGGPYLLLYIKDVQVQENIKGFHTGILNMKQFHLSRHVPRSCSCCPPQVRRRNSDPIDHWSTHRCPMVELLRVNRVDRFMMFHVVTKGRNMGCFSTHPYAASIPQDKSNCNKHRFLDAPASNVQFQFRCQKGMKKHCCIQTYGLPDLLKSKRMNRQVLPSTRGGWLRLRCLQHSIFHFGNRTNELAPSS